MLTVKKSVTLTGTSAINSNVAERYTATIDETDPNAMSMNSSTINKSLYKENRETCRSDRAEFEESVYALQDEMLAALEEDTES